MRNAENNYTIKKVITVSHGISRSKSRWNSVQEETVRKYFKTCMEVKYSTNILNDFEDDQRESIQLVR